jgi:sigma-B regulation protein RsbU (phosphoserine phosphatase)
MHTAQIKPKILLVDDEPNVLRALNRLFRDYDVSAVDSAEEALRVAREKLFDVVISDYRMPGMDGVTLLCKFKAIQPNAVRLILTSYADLENTQRAINEAEVFRFINKPWDNNEILNAVSRALEHKRILSLSDELLATQEAIQQDLQMAGNMQRRMLPVSASNIQGVAIDWLFRPSTHVSGDIFNFFRLGEHHIGFYIIDVAGHGIAAAMQSFSLSHLLTPGMNPNNPLKQRQSEPPYYEVVRPSSAVVTNLNLQFQTDTTHILYFTMVYGVIDTQAQVIDLCQAGHPHSLHLARGNPPQFICESGLPVGIMMHSKYKSSLLKYQVGDRLFFYSDGITECMSADEEMFGTERLQAFIEDTRMLPISEVIRQLDERMRLWHGSNAFDDDISMLVLEISEDRKVTG